MNQNYTDISIVQDSSGSMEKIRDETIDGYNKFIEEQRSLPGKCLVTLTQFNTEFSVVYAGLSVHDTRPLNRSTYAPGGGTALLDAIARTIQTTGHRLELMSESERPGKVVVVIITDGEENSSHEFAGQAGKAKVNEMIERQKTAYAWSFVFLGANQDAIQTGGSMGVASATSMSCAATSEGTAEAYAALTTNMKAYRLCDDPVVAEKALAFTAQQRAEQQRAGASVDATTAKP